MGIFFFPLGSVGVIRAQVRFLLWVMFSAQAFGAGLGSYADLVVSDSPATRHNGVRVTYLGTNGYQFEFKGHALLVDPYFSRVDLLRVAFGSRIQPDIPRIAFRQAKLARKKSAVLGTLMRENWPHAPPHYFTPNGIYIITAATLHRKRLFDSKAKLNLLRDTTFELARNYQLIL